MRKSKTANLIVNLSCLGLLSLLPMSLSAAMTSEAVASLIARSENGDSFSQMLLGKCYAEGNGVARDEAEAIRWYRLAAAAGQGRANLMLGNAYRDGKGVVKDEVESYVYYAFSGDALGGREKDALDLNLAPELRLRCQQGVRARWQAIIDAEQVNWRKKHPKDALSFDNMKTQAEQGDATAQVRLSIYYTSNISQGGFRECSPEEARRNLIEAAKWCRLAAEQGHSGAQTSYALCCAEGKGVMVDNVEAAKWLRKAANQGDMFGQYLLGNAYAKGAGVEKNLVQAVKWYRLSNRDYPDGYIPESYSHLEAAELRLSQYLLVRAAAERGDAPAQYVLANAYADGTDVARDPTEAVSWCRKSADLGNDSARKALPVLEASAHSYKLIREAAELGDPDAQLALGNIYEQFDRDEVGARKWWRKAAEQGHVAAQEKIGMDCLSSYLLNDECQGVEWLTKAAKGGAGFYALRGVGDAYAGTYRHGGSRQIKNAVPKDLIEGYAYLNLASQLREPNDLFAGILRHQLVEMQKTISPEASLRLLKRIKELKDDLAASAADYAKRQAASRLQESIGARKPLFDAIAASESAIHHRLYEQQHSGNGVTRDKAQAVSWYRKAAEQGDAKVQYFLGVCYYYGEGVAKDDVEAVKWWRQAAEQGDANAQYYLGVCYFKGEGVAKDEIEAYGYWNLAGMTDDDVGILKAMLEKKMSPGRIAAGKKRTIELQKEIEAKMAAKKVEDDKKAGK